MKTVMKKLLSVVLVAILLVSAVPFQANAADGGYSVQIKVYVNEEYKETLTESASSEAEMLAWKSLTAADIAEGLELSYYDPDNGDTVTGFANSALINDGTTLVWNLWITTKSTGTDDNNNSGSGSTGSGSGEAQPDVSVGKVSLSIKYNLSGYADQTVKATQYAKYKDYVGEPARNGYDFLGWYSSNYGRIIDITKDTINADDTIEAKWSEAKSFNLTLDENRDGEEYVNYGVKVTYGENIYEKVSKYNPTRKGYVFMGWKLNGKIIDKNTVWDLPDDATAYAVWKLESDTSGEAMGGTSTADGKVYLDIYINGDTSAPEKRVDITSYADDNKITRTEVETVVKKYVTAKSGYTLSYEGLFDEESWWWYTRDPETDGEATIVVNRDGDDYVYVMVNNVKTVEADTTNPKTGDMIVVPMIFMLGSAAALALDTKKRFFK